MTQPTDLEMAVAHLQLAEATEPCPFCRTHITEVRILTEDLLALSRVSDDIAASPMARALFVKLGEVGERLGALSSLGRLVHRLRGSRR
jgi:hypothetical protein